MTSEIALVGAILLDHTVFGQVRELVSIDDFSNQTARKVWKAATALAEAGLEPDPIAVKQKIADAGGIIDDVTLDELMAMASTAANVEWHAVHVHEAAQTRILHGIGEDLIWASDTSTVTSAIQRLDKVRQGYGAGKLVTSSQAVDSIFHDLDQREHGMFSFVPTGFHKLDKLLGGGMKDGGLYILAARPGVGKTTLALNIADQIAGPVLFVSLEMAVEQLNNKRLARIARINVATLTFGLPRDSEITRLANAANIVAQSELRFNRGSGATVAEIGSLARSIPELKAIVIDYLQLVSGERQKTRYEQITDISRELKLLALSLDVPILTLSQLSRDVEKRSNKRPQLSDLRDSGAIEQDADGVLLLSRVDENAQQDNSAPILAVLELAKNRHGPTGEVKFEAYLSTSDFREW